MKIPDYVDHFFLLAPQYDFKASTPLGKFANYSFFTPRGFNADLVDPELLKILFSPDPTLTQDQYTPITRFMSAIHQVRPDLQGLFNLQTSQGRYEFIKWFLLHGTKEVFRPNVFSVKNEIGSIHGVNLIGFVHATFGLGEFLKSTRKSLDSYSIAHHSIDTEDKVAVLKHKVNVFCLPGMEHYKLPYKYDWPLFKETYNVGYWPWELDQWSKKYDFCFGASDEIWAIIKFSQEALQKSTQQVVHHMPIAVLPPVVGSFQRKDFGLDDSRFYFLGILDFNSYVARKNPMGVLKAFKKAFAGNDKVGMVFKTLNLDPTKSDSKAFLDEIAGDPRVVVINEDLQKEKLWALIKTCNAYISLHRAEGFGLPIAEAMLMGLPVVCTGYSGNLDFTRDDNSYLVKHTLIEIAPGEYHFFEAGQKWAEPSIDHAAEQMLKLFQNPTEAQAKAQKGKATIENEFSVQAIGAKMKQRLEAIYQKL